MVSPHGQCCASICCDALLKAWCLFVLVSARSHVFVCVFSLPFSALCGAIQLTIEQTDDVSSYGPIFVLWFLVSIGSSQAGMFVVPHPSIGVPALVCSRRSKICETSAIIPFCTGVPDFQFECVLVFLLFLLLVWLIKKIRFDW